MEETDTRIHSLRGGITREGDWTIIRLGGRNRDGFLAGCRVDVETRRLHARPGLLKDTLDRMARDLPRYDLV